MQKSTKELQQSNKAHQPLLQQHDVSGSALIAEFMEIKEVESSYDNYGRPEPIWYAAYLGYRTPAFSVKGKSVEHLLNENKFNSWEWLMPVVEKICKTKIGDGVEYVEYPHLRTFGMINSETGNFMVRFNGFQCFEAKDLFQATWEAVIDFLRWWSKADR